MSEEKINHNSLIDKVLGYVDSPFKLFAIVLMAVFAFTGYFVWQNQDAVVVAIFKVNPIFGTRVLYRAYTKDGRDKTHEGLDVGLFTPNAANNRDVVALMAGEIPCGAYKTAQSEIGLWYIEKGVVYGCRVSVPPEQGKFIGQITVGWKEEPPDVDAYRVLLQIAATMLSRSKQ